MFSSLKELYSLLTRDQRNKLLRLQLLVVLMSFAEIAGVVSVGPFMALVGDIDRLQGEGMVAELFRATGVNDPKDFLFWLGIGVMTVFSISALTIWRLSLQTTFAVARGSCEMRDGGTVRRSNVPLECFYTRKQCAPRS